MQIGWVFIAPLPVVCVLNLALPFCLKTTIALKNTLKVVDVYIKYSLLSLLVTEDYPIVIQET